MYPCVSLFTKGFQLERINFGWFQDIPTRIVAVWISQLPKLSGFASSGRHKERKKKRLQLIQLPRTFWWYVCLVVIWEGGLCSLVGMLKFGSKTRWWFFLCMFVAMMAIVQLVFWNCPKKTGYPVTLGNVSTCPHQYTMKSPFLFVIFLGLSNAAQTLDEGYDALGAETARLRDEDMGLQDLMGCSLFLPQGWIFVVDGQDFLWVHQKIKRLIRSWDWTKKNGQDNWDLSSQKQKYWARAAIKKASFLLGSPLQMDLVPRGPSIGSLNLQN